MLTQYKGNIRDIGMVTNTLQQEKKQILNVLVRDFIDAIKDHEKERKGEGLFGLHILISVHQEGNQRRKELKAGTETEGMEEGCLLA